MGAYLYYKLEESSFATRANDFLDKNKTNEKLGDEGIFFYSKEDILWAEENNPEMTDYYKGKVGTGDIKTSGVECRCNTDPEEILEMQTVVFEELNSKFGMEYYANSCALSEEEYYFSIPQMKRFTNNGKFLSGKTSKDERARELYDKYYKMLSCEEELFDISIIKENDSLLMTDGEWHKVYNRYGTLSLKWQTGSVYGNKSLEKIAKDIKGHRKYVPSIRYGGVETDVEAYIIDKGVLIYLETVGSENMIKSITSVLMQGRMKLKKQSVDSTFGMFTINKAGNRRKLTALDNGLAHAILYHSPSITDTDFSVLIGRDKKELLTSFSAWLEKSQPLPYPQELISEIYESLLKREKLEELTSLKVEAIKVDTSILEDDAYDLQEVILEVCKANGLINPNPAPLKSDMLLPESKYLRKSQVKKIYNILNKMPKTYELEDVEIKPIGLKLFSPNKTLYITEADKGCESEEFNMHTQCFGYVENLNDPQMSEWGYINVPEYLKATYKPVGGFEQDLHFEDMYIDNEGNIGSFQELGGIAV